MGILGLHSSASTCLYGSGATSPINLSGELTLQWAIRLLMAAWGIQEDSMHREDGWGRETKLYVSGSAGLISVG